MGFIKTSPSEFFFYLNFMNHLPVPGVHLPLELGDKEIS